MTLNLPFYVWARQLVLEQWQAAPQGRKLSTWDLVVIVIIAMSVVVASSHDTDICGARYDIGSDCFRVRLTIGSTLKASYLIVIYRYILSFYRDDMSIESASFDM